MSSSDKLHLNGLILYPRATWCTFTLACMHAQSFSHVRLFATPGTIARQAPLSKKFSQQEYWRGWPFLLQEIFLDRNFISCVSYISRQILYHWATRKAYLLFTLTFTLRVHKYCSRVLWVKGQLLLYHFSFHWFCFWKFICLQSSRDPTLFSTLFCVSPHSRICPLTTERHPVSLHLRLFIAPGVWNPLGYKGQSKILGPLNL